MIGIKIVMTIAVAWDPYHVHRLVRNRVANHSPDCCLGRKQVVMDKLDRQNT